MGMHYFTDEQVKELEKNPNQIFLTDIAYLTYDLNQCAYISGEKDGVTHEMHGYKVSHDLDITFV